MFRNSTHNPAGDQITRPGSRLARTINFSACVYYSDLWFCYSPDSDKCEQLLRLVCRRLGHAYNCIHRIVLRLHKVTCLFLRREPAGRNDLNPLPDVLKDVATIKMVRAGPDVIPFHQESSTIRQEGAGSSLIMTTTTYSSHQLNIGGHKNRYSLSHLCYCNSNIDSHEDSTRDMTSHHNNGYCSTENSDVMYCQVAADGGTRDGTSAIHRPSDTDSPRQISRTNQFTLSGRFNNKKSNGIHEYNHAVIIPDLQTSHIQSNSYTNDTGGRGVYNHEDNKTQAIGHQPQKCDSEIARDIVLALRRVGDNLDTRLRYENKKSLLALMGAPKISDSWVEFLTLGQRSMFGAMVCLSLELLHQLNRL